MFECDACEGTGKRLVPSAEVFRDGWKIAECDACRGLGHVVEATPAPNGDSMHGTIGHLRNVADLVDALDLDAILGEAGINESTSRHINGHREREILEAAIWAGVGALRRLADIVEEATAEEEEGDAPSFTTRQVHDLADEAARAGDRETVEACEAYLDNPEAGWAADIIDEALSYAAAQ